jgi:hypothetical protein
MAAIAYITANTSNGDENMRRLRNLALKGVWVLQGMNEQGHDATPRRNVPSAEQLRHQAPAPAVAPRPQVVEPINGELRHGLAQNRVDLPHARRDACRFEDECELETFGNGRHGLCGAECFSILIRSTLLPKGIKLSDSVVKFNRQQDPRIWLDDFITIVTISGGSRDNTLKLLSLHLKDNARAWLTNLAPDSIRSWDEFWQAFIVNFRGTSRWPTSFKELCLCMQKIGESLRSYISRWLSLRNTSENISPERAIDAFRDGLIRRDFREELGQCMPKTIDHLMSLANTWADREDSITNPRSHRRSADRDVDPKDQLHSSSRQIRQKGRQSRYGDSDTADMVAGGYVNNDHDDNHDGPRGTLTTEAVAEAPAVTRGQKRSGVGVVTNHHLRRKKCSTEGAPGTPTSTRMEGENQHISSSSAGNSSGLAKRFKKRCGTNSLSQAPWLITHHQSHLICHQTRCNTAIRPPRSNTSSNHGSRSSRKKRSLHHVVSCL